jgi:hypothetical protein
VRKTRNPKRSEKSQTSTMSHKASYFIGKQHKLLSRCVQIDMAEAIWVLNSARGKTHVVLPPDYNYPINYITAKIGEEGSIFGWELETILTTTFGLKKNLGNRTLNPRSWASISTILNYQRKIEDCQSVLPSIEQILESMTRLLYRQLPWQEHATLRSPMAGRWWLIFCTPNLRDAFIAKAGVDIDKFVKLSLVLYELFGKNPYCVKPKQLSLLGISETDIIVILNLLSSSEDEISQKCKHATKSEREAAYRISPFRERPLIRITRNNTVQYMCPMQQLLAWRITKGLYYDVVSQPDAPRLIGAAFENYMVRLCKAAFPEAMVSGDFNYGTKTKPKQSPDVVISLDGEVIFVIECKGKRATKAIQLQLGQSKEKTMATDEIAKGVAQLSIFYERLSRGEVEGLKPSSKICSLVVTLDDWIFWGDSLDPYVTMRAQELLKRNVTPESQIEKIAFCNAFDFERLVSNFTLLQILEIIPASRIGEYRTHRLWDFAQSNLKDREFEPSYPLQHELNAFLVN